MPLIIRPYIKSDRPAIRKIYGIDEFARPQLLQKYPQYSEYLADDMSYYPDFEPESLFVAESKGQVVGALLGAIDTKRFEQIYQRQIRSRLLLRLVTGVYGWPGWLPAILYTEWAERKVIAPKVECSQYPAHLHIGILPEWRRRGIGTALMMQFAEYLKMNGIPGYHLYASSFHALGVAFYQKLGLELLGQFDWQLHTGFGWMNVTERIFGMRIR
jgi:ribosomal protein S18 acetylase RimI-like enzyme